MCPSLKHGIVSQDGSGQYSRGVPPSMVMGANETRFAGCGKRGCVCYLGGSCD